MNDLLGAKGGQRKGDAKKPQSKTDVEMGDPEPDPKDPGMLQFFQEVNSIKADTAKIRQLLKRLQVTHEESNVATAPSVLKDLRRRLEADVDEVTKTAQSIKRKLGAIDKSNIVNRKKPGYEEGSSTDRTRMSMTLTLKKKLKEVMTEFQDLRQKFQDDYREVIERRIFTGNFLPLMRLEEYRSLCKAKTLLTKQKCLVAVGYSNITGQKPDEETVDNLIETGDSESIFQKAIQEQGRGQVLNTVKEIQDRHDSVKDMERKLLDLHQIFIDMAVLVEAQGEMLDNIEVQVSKASDQVQKGSTVLQVAKKLQHGKRKWMCIGIILLLIVIIIILVAVLGPWRNGKA